MKLSIQQRLLTGIAVAVGLWFYMFSPWTSHLSNFWVNMTISAVILTALSLSLGGKPAFKASDFLRQSIIGIVIALALWGVFWLGNFFSSLLFDFARPEVLNVYALKEGTSPYLIAALLLLVIGPAEELFWRGFVQKSFAQVLSDNAAFIVTTVIYALAHIWSFNFMLVMAALVAGAVWGFIYRLNPRLLPALIISHALWDALVFVIWPI